MHSYSYHLKIELYPSPDPWSINQPIRDAHGGSSSGPIWRPDVGSSIFDVLPSHPDRHSDPAAISGSLKQREKQRSIDQLEQYLSPEDRHFLQRAPARVIDCGTSRPLPPAAHKDDGEVDFPSTSRRRERSRSFPAPGHLTGIGPRSAARDWRFGSISIESFDVPDGSQGQGPGQSCPTMAGSAHPSPAASLGPNLGGPGTDTKGEFVPLTGKKTEAGWGIVHLYREPHEPGAASTSTESLSGGDGTILCIPAVPGYLSPIGFLNFVGRRWMSQVAHYRMLMTSALGTYMVLIKCRDHHSAEAWRKEFDGKTFGPMREEGICHVTFIKSITIAETTSQPEAGSSKSSAVNHLSSLKPFPPPTPDLVELPTCTVCLERMDDTSGLITIPCQHVFHCTCLQSWMGSGCPVCRATNPAQQPADPSDPYSHPFGHGISNICVTCDTTDDLWICLICGNVGCGRYKGGHAKEHWKETAHCFSLELETQHVWDYAGDMWVHRLIREKGEGKVVEFPSTDMAARDGNRQAGPDMDVVPRAKLDNIGMEYTNLLSSQLESQRVYFEEMISKAADKAAKASAAAEAASSQAAEALSRLHLMEEAHSTLKGEIIPQLERDLERERKRGDRSTELARKLGQSLQEEKKINEGLLEKVQHVNRALEVCKAQNEELSREVAEQKDMNHDLTLFISGQEKLKEMEQQGQITQEELEEGDASVPEKKGRGKGKNRGKGKGKQ
ncbi:RING finger protein [Diaporthe helianthi]|uniref:RING finger protein n=1 Tax=Diaporthe helianthi TaxID=158607 RepID=A0A2P5I213_DIAHE|nr:RING finger protein [Diaporthe helianthi]